MQRPTFSALSMACLLAFGAACSSGRAGDATSGYTKLDDMEGTSGLTWWSATDCTEADRILPAPYIVELGGWSFAPLPAPHETFHGVVSTHAARLRTTSPLTGVWGASMGLNFGVSPPATLGPARAGAPCKQTTALDFPGGTTVDLGAYAGITFWGMADPAGAKIFRVLLQDRNTDPRGGACNAADPSGDGDCYNGFGTRLELTDALTPYTIDFADVSQNPNWGYHPDPNVLDLQHVYSLAFQFDAATCVAAAGAMCAGGGMPPASFDLWIDDIYLVNR